MFTLQGLWMRQFRARSWQRGKVRRGYMSLSQQVILKMTRMLQTLTTCPLCPWGLFSYCGIWRIYETKGSIKCLDEIS